MLVDNNIQKLDTVSDEYIRRIDRPGNPSYKVEEVIGQLVRFEGHVVVQTLFMKGKDAEGAPVDNTGEEYVAPWVEALRRIRPSAVMVYTIDRETPLSSLEKATREELNAIADRVRTEIGIEVEVAY